MYSRSAHAERIATTFGFDCASCRAAIVSNLNAPDIGAVYVARRDDGVFKIVATTSSPAEHLREMSLTTKREHTLVHTIAVLDSRALEGHLRRRLDTFLDDRRQWYSLAPGVVDAICATRHLCDVPSPYGPAAMNGTSFSNYVRGIDRAIAAGAG